MGGKNDDVKVWKSNDKEKQKGGKAKGRKCNGKEKQRDGKAQGRKEW